MEKVTNDYKFFHMHGSEVKKNKAGEFIKVIAPLSATELSDFIDDIGYYEIKRDGVLKLLNGTFSKEFNESKYCKEAELLVTQKRLVGITLAFDKDTGEWNAALCSSLDQFSKRKGRWISLGRLKKYGSAGRNGG